MLLLRKLGRQIATMMAMVMFLISAPLHLAQAALVTTDSVIGSMSAAQDREAVLNFLSREDVADQFRSLGVTPDEARARVNAMSDEEVRQVAGKLDQIPAGEGVLGFLVFVVLIALLVLVITDLAGATDVFPFINPVK